MPNRLVQLEVNRDANGRPVALRIRVDGARLKTSARALWDRVRGRIQPPAVVVRLRQRLRRYVRIETEHPTMSWDELQAQLAENRAAVEHWKAEYQRVAEERQSQKASGDAQRRTAEERLLRIISPEALGHVLPQRLSIARRRARGADALARLQHFTQASSCYRQALAEPVPAGVVRGVVAGIDWCTPPDAPRPFFDVYAISQTRDVAIGGVTIEVGAGTGLASVARVTLGDSLAAYCTEADPVAYRCLVTNVSSAGLDGLVLPDHVAIGGDGPNAMTLDRWVARLGIDVALVGFVQIKHVTPVILAGAAGLLARPHISWQLEFEPELVGDDDMGALLEQLGAHFTHFIVASHPPPGTRVRSISELDAVVEAAGHDNIALVLYRAATTEADAALPEPALL